MYLGSHVCGSFGDGVCGGSGGSYGLVTGGFYCWLCGCILDVDYFWYVVSCTDFWVRSGVHIFIGVLDVGVGVSVNLIVDSGFVIGGVSCCVGS